MQNRLLNILSVTDELSVTGGPPVADASYFKNSVFVVFMVVQ